MSALRVATANLLSGRSLSTGQVDERTLRSSLQALDADVVGLQEVDRGQPRSNGIDQPAVIADALGADWWHFAPSLRGEPGVRWSPADDDDDGGAWSPTYGIALASRLEVRRFEVRRFPPARWGTWLLVPGQGLMRVPDEPRRAIAAEVIGPAGPFTVATTHLSFMPGWNVRQLRALVRWLNDWPAPRLLVGDLNLPGPLPRRISGWEQLARVATYPSWRPRIQWDHVLADGVGTHQVRRVHAERMAISDHCALVVDLDL